mmetsp:Transcript_18350/g.17464  ORF Transcript_18350/g.17464 Transcript_18350/m.17464 type:complete len:88 (-) Transcript_18350:115-378(-)
MIAYSICTFFNDHSLKFVHALMVFLPLSSDELGLIVYLLIEVLTQLLQLVLKLLLEGIQGLVGQLHLLDSKLLVQLNLLVGIFEALL